MEKSLFAKKGVSTLTIVTMLATFFGPFGLHTSYAALTGTFVSSVITPNAPATTGTQSVTSFTITTQGQDTDTFSVDGCSIAFLNSGPLDTDCTDMIGRVDTMVDVTPSDQAIRISTFIFSNYVASLGGTGQFILTHTGTPIVGNPTITPSGNISISTTNTVVGVAPTAAVAQVVDFTPTAPTIGETYSGSINSTTFTYTVTGSLNVAQLTAILEPLMEANAATTCSEDGAKITCTADVAGTPFTYSAAVVDITAPVLTQVTPIPTPTNDNTPNFTFSSTESGTLSYAGGCLGNIFTASSGSNTITFDPFADGTYTSCRIQVRDYDGLNLSNILTLPSFTIDTTAPTVTINKSVGQADPTNVPIFNFTIVFSEPIDPASFSGLTDLTGSTFAFPDAYLNSLTTSDNITWTLNVGTYGQPITSFTLPAGVVTDLAGNPNTASTSTDNTVAYDNVRPEFTITAVPTTLIAGGTSSLTFTLSEPSTNFSSGDVSVTGGTLSAFAGTGTSYTAIFTPAVSSTTTGTIDIAESAFTDLVGNNNLIGSGVSISIDTTVPAVTLSTTAPTVTNTGFVVQVNFTEGITGFTGGDISITNATISAFTGATASDYSFFVTPTTDGVININVGTGSAQDTLGNPNTAATELSRTYDATSPTIMIGATPMTTLSGQTSALTFTLSEPSVNFSSGDVVVVGGTLSAFAGSGTGYTATFTPTLSSSATGTINIGTATFTDAAGNNNTAATQVSISVDTIVPTIAITANPAVVNSGSTAVVTFTLSEPSINFDFGDVTVTGGLLTGFAGSGTVYTATFTPSVVTTTTGAVDVAAASFTDVLGNPNVAAPQYLFAVDTLSPTPVLTSAFNPTNGTFTVTATFAEPVTGMTITDFAVTNGAKTTFVPVSSSVYTININPNVANGTVTIDIAPSAAMDLSSNPSLAAATLLIVDIDTVVPTAMVEYSNTGITNMPVTATLTGASESITITNNSGSSSRVFSSNGSFVFDFVDAAGNTGSVTATVGNIDVTPPTASISYSTTGATNMPVTATLTGASESITITNNSGSSSHVFSSNGTFVFDFVDAAGNTGSTTATVGNIDVTSPTASISYSTTGATNMPVTATLTGASESITITNNSGSSSRVFSSNGSFVFDFVDAAGNTGSVTATVGNIDVTSPTVSLTSTSALSLNDDFYVTATFSEDVTGVSLSDFTVTNGTKSSLATLSSTGYTILVSPSGDGIVTVTFTGSMALDSVGNGNTVSNTLSRTYDGTDPLVSLSTSSPNPTNGAFIVTATFSESVTGVTLSDFVVTNGTPSSLTGMSSTGYSVLVTPTVDGNVTVNMPIAAATDMAGNNSTAAAVQVSIDVDTVSPTVTIVASSTNLIAGQTSTLTFTLSEASTTFTGSDVSASGGTISGFNGSGTGFSAVFTPTPSSSSTGVIVVGTGVLLDAAGNGNIASLETLITIDTVAPTVILSTSASGKTNTGFTVIANFSESVTGMTLGAFSVINGVPSGFTTLSGASYTVYVTPTSDGIVTVSMTGGVAQDTTGNSNMQATSLTRIYDTTGPVVSLVGSGTQTVALGSTYADLGATWTDVADGSGAIAVASSGSVNTSATGVYVLSYTKTDIASNTGNTVTRTVTVTDQTGPVTTLVGASTISLVRNTAYTELGATWIDNVDGTGTLATPYNGSVDIATLGSYVLSYRHIDTAGNTGATVTRTVTVIAPSGGGSSGGGGGGSSQALPTVLPTATGATVTGVTIPTTPATTTPSTPTTSQNTNVIDLPVIVDPSNIIARDISKSKYKDSIRILIQKGVFQNVTKINPLRPITRAEFVKLLSSFTGFKKVTSKKVFRDVDYTTEISDYISYGVESGWINKTNMNFRPNDTITVAEAMKLINVVLNKASSDTVVGESSSLTRGQAADLIVKNLGIK